MPDLRGFYSDRPMTDEELEEIQKMLDLLILQADTQAEKILAMSAAAFLNHIRYQTKEINKLNQHIYTLECMLHAEDKIPYDPDQIRGTNGKIRKEGKEEE